MFVFLLAILVLLPLLRRKRLKGMQELATKLDFRKQPDDRLPRDLDLRVTSLGRVQKTFNCFEGVLHGMQVTLFDLRVKQGKGSAARSLVAVRTPVDPPTTPAGLEVRRSGPWLLYYKPLGFMLGGGKVMDRRETETLLHQLTSTAARQP